MKRLKTICLSLFVYFSLSLQVGFSQSSSCASETNLSVDPLCRYTITTEMLRTTGPAASAQSIKLVVGNGTISTFSGGAVSGSIIDLGIPQGGQVQYELYATPDGTGPMVCWGHINFEMKSIPEPIITVYEVMCSQPLPDLPSISELEAQINTLCSAPITDLVESVDIQGEACSGWRKVRKITGIIDYGDIKVPTPLIIDTIIETPLDTGMVFGPFGGPNKQDAIILFCQDIGNKFPTPEVVEEYAPQGIQAAYPNIPKGLDTTITFKDTTITLSDTIEQKVLITDDSGVEYWVMTNVIEKRDTLITIADTTITDIVLPIKVGPTCNLSAKYTDEEFPGCAGPDSKIRRTWSILDWCNGSLKETVQWIIVETEGPKITPVKDGFAAITPWLCYASFKLSAEIDKECSESLQVIFQSSVGIVEDNNLLTGLWLGEVAEVTVTAIDDCGQRSVDTFYVTPVDSIAPVAIAADQINVTLSGDPLIAEPIEDRGVAKVFVDAINEGSHNAGCGDVDICLLLKEERENPVIIDSVHARIDGKLIYHSFGCVADGIIPAVQGTKTIPARPEIRYVFCKEYVKFCCESLGMNSVAMIVTNTSDRQAVTWTNVLVEDKSSPIVICPQPFTVGCDEDFDIPQPVIFNGVCSIDELEMTMTDDIDNCGNGIKTVVWTRNGAVICINEITIDAKSRFNPYEIKWPKHFNNDDVPGIRRECELLIDDDGDAILDDEGNEQYVIVEYDDEIPMGQPFECTGEGFTGEPVWCISACGLIGVNFEDLNVQAVGACRKILRKWTLIDWCTWDPNNDSIDDENDSFDSFTAITDEWLGEGDWLTDRRTTEGKACEECDKPAGQSDDVYFRYDTVDIDGYYSFDQVIKILDYDEPVVTAPDTINLSIFGGAGFKGDDFDECFTSDVTSATVTDMCGSTSIDVSNAGWFIQVFKLNDGVEELLATKEFFGEEATMSTQMGMTGDVHIIRWIVKDACGNQGSADTYVLFLEDKNPTPLCIQNLSTSTMSTDGTATIWATDFDAGSFDNCSEVDLFFKDADGNYSPSLTFECGNIDDGLSQIFDLELYAVDALGNFDFCNVSLRVDDFNDNCPNSIVDPGAENEVSGAVATALGDMVEDVAVSLNVGMMDMTSVEGKYAFNDLSYSAFDISAEKNDDYLNGVSSLDVVLIQRHLLGASPLDSPYKIIAADINGDGRVSALDLVDLRKLILGVYDELPRNRSWRFVDASQKFDNNAIPFPFVEMISINDFEGSARGQNFVAVKIGDVNGNAIANSLITAGARSTGILSLQIEDAQVTKGDIVEVAMQSTNFSNITAYQFTMELSGLEFIGATSGAIDVSPSNFGMLDAQTVTTAWFSPEGVTVEEELYTMTFKATDNIRLSDAFAISSRITNAIAYTASQDRLEVGMEYYNLEGLQYSLLQNTPNPFEEVTYIGFELPEAGSATLTVMDVTGKRIKVIKNDFRRGYNEIALRNSDLGASGVLYYQLESGDFTATRKMILIE